MSKQALLLRSHTVLVRPIDFVATSFCRCPLSFGFSIPLVVSVLLIFKHWISISTNCDYLKKKKNQLHFTQGVLHEQ